jgi:multiple sugar transport system substrate-binding protein
VISEHVDKYGYVESTSPETIPILEVLSKRLSAAWAGQTSIDDALTQAQSEVLELLK